MNQNRDMALWSEPFFNSLFSDRYFLPEGMKWTEKKFSPEYDIEENEQNYRLTFEIPGLKEEDIKIEVAQGTLTVSGEKKSELREDKKISHRVGRSYGKFVQSFTLPQEVDAGKVEAQFKNGVLQILLPKAATAKPRQIEIRRAD